jgi:hypothetical protein
MCKSPGVLTYDWIKNGEQVSLHFDYDWGDAKFDRVRVAKLHGSSNFIAQLGRIETALLASTAVHVEVPLIILPVENLEKGLGEKLSGGEPAYLPIMSQVSRYKEQLLAPVKIQQMRNGWNAGVHDAKVVAIIGVSFNRYDRHIIEPIESASATVLYIGDEASFKMWNAVNGRTQQIERTLEDGFDALLTRLGIA